MNKNYAYIKFTGTENIYVITNILNLKPSKVWNVGDKRANGSIYNFSCWLYECTDFEKTFLDEAILEVVRFVESKKVVFSNVPSGFKFTVQCVGHHEKDMPGFHLSHELVEKLYKIGAAIDFDLYCHIAD